jgi:thiol-disulfide isomerase/thioredoxin
MKNIKLFLLSIAFLSGNVFASSLPFSEKSGFSTKEVVFKDNIVDIDGNIFTDIDTESNNIYVVFFSTTWCCHCPDVAKIMSKVAHDMIECQNVKFLYVLVGNESDKEVKKHFNINLPKNVSICKSISSFSLKGVDIVPSCIVFNRQGKQVFRYDGKVDYNCQEFKQFLLRLSTASDAKNIRKDSYYGRTNPEKSGARELCCKSKSNGCKCGKWDSSRS